MGYKKLSEDQERQLVEEYKKGTPVKELMAKYGYKTKKSITDKVKKYYPNDYSKIVAQAQDSRRGYAYSLKEITSPFDAYLVGLLLTDGYILTDRDGIGLDMTDEDVISFIAETVGTTYSVYTDDKENHKSRFRVVITRPGIKKEVERYGIVPKKTFLIQAPMLLPAEIKYLPYIIRGIIDGDGCVSKTSYGGSQFYIVTMSEVFADWIIKILTDNFFMEDVRKSQNSRGLWRVESANQYNILKLIALVYNKPFGMNRKYSILRKTFRDYNRDILLDEDDGIVQTATK